MTEASSITFVDAMKGLAAQVDQALDHYSAAEHGCPPHLNEAIRYSLLAPGKRLRPILVLLAAEACGCQLERAMPAACAVEMIHSYSLIHDDLPAMDDDDLRRGRPTCHRQFGEAVAILAGDALLTKAFELLASEVTPPEVALKCSAALARAAGAANMVGGQADDLQGTEAGDDIERLQSIHARKTGAMISVSLELGGLIAGATQAQQAGLADFGCRLGMAFQIVDDLLDVQGTEEQTGKRVGKDADRGKVTYPGLLGVDESRRLARQLIDEACESLAPLAPRHETLAALARFVVERDR